MKVTIQHQEEYSRGELLLRSFFGLFYIAIPHFFGLFFYSIWVAILQIYAFFSILFTEKMPRSTYEAVVGYTRWNLRVNASLSNLVDGYPPFGPSERWEKADFDIGYNERVTRKRLLFIVFLGAYAVIPQLIVLVCRQILGFFIQVIAWFVVLFTAKYPADMHKFLVETMRLNLRVNAYLSMLYFVYPEFTGEETETDRKHS